MSYFKNICKQVKKRNILPVQYNNDDHAHQELNQFLPPVQVAIYH